MGIDRTEISWDELWRYACLVYRPVEDERYFAMIHLYFLPQPNAQHRSSLPLQCFGWRASPAEVVRRAAAQGVQVLALTDHDDIAGLAEARETAREAKIDLINGVEISTSWAVIPCTCLVSTSIQRMQRCKPGWKISVRAGQSAPYVLPRN